MGSVATAVLEGFIVFAPQESVSGYGNQQQPGSASDAPDFAKRIEIVIGVLEYIERSDHIECSIIERQFFHRRKGDILKPAHLTEMKRVYRRINSHNRAVAGRVPHFLF